MKGQRKVYILLALCVLWSIIIFIGCTLPPNQLPKWRFLQIPHIDKAAHFGFFFVQSVLLSLVFHFKTYKKTFLVILFSTLLAFVYGGAIELMQSAYFHRTADMYDLLADVLGGFTGATIYPFLSKLSGKS